MRVAVAGLCALLAGGCSCGDEPASLTVDLRTDFVPVEEMAAVRVELFAGAEPASMALESVEGPALASFDYIAGARVAELEGLGPGPRLVRVSLLDGAGGAFAERRTRVDLEGRISVIVVIARDPRECATNEVCAPDAACAEGRCIEGTCFAAPIPDACAASEWCDPEGGCRPRGGGPDAGPADAGPPDAGPADAEPPPDTGPSDAGPPDAGPPDAGPPDAGPPPGCRTAADCNDSNSCTEDSCVPPTCVHVPIVCPNDGNDCTIDSCSGGGCPYTPRDGAACGDGNLCTEAEVCFGTECRGRPVRDGDPCPGGTCTGGVCG